MEKFDIGKIDVNKLKLPATALVSSLLTLLVSKACEDDQVEINEEKVEKVYIMPEGYEFDTISFLESVTGFYGDKFRNLLMVEAEAKELQTYMSTDSARGRYVSKIIDLWSKHETGVRRYAFFDYYNDKDGELLKLCGEDVLKNSPKMSYFSIARKKYNEEGICLAEQKIQGNKHSPVVKNSWMDMGQRKTAGEVKGMFEAEYKDRIEEGLESGIAGLIEKYGDKNGARFFSMMDRHKSYDYFQAIVAGQAGIESTFDTSAVSTAEARGFLQIIDPTRKHLEKKYSKITTDRDYRKMSQVDKDIFLLVAHYADVFEYMERKLDKKYKKAFDSFVKDKDQFENIIIPLLVTGYNQGPVRAANLFKLLIDLHDKGLLENHSYSGDKNLWNLNEDAVLETLFTALKIVKGKDFDGFEDFYKNNKDYGLAGSEYYLKSLAAGLYFYIDKYESTKPVKVKKVVVIKPTVKKAPVIKKAVSHPKYGNMSVVKKFTHYKLGVAQMDLNVRDTKTGKIIGKVELGNVIDIMGVAQKGALRRYWIRHGNMIGTVTRGRKYIKVR